MEFIKNPNINYEYAWGKQQDPTESEVVRLKFPNEGFYKWSDILNGTVNVDVSCSYKSDQKMDIPINDLIDWSQPDPIKLKVNDSFEIGLNSWDLREPLKAHSHIEPTQKKYQCDQCVKSFTKARNRKRHIKVNH